MQRQIADLVEEKRAAISGLDPPDPVGTRVGERPLHMAEQLAVDQLGRDRAEIHRLQNLARTLRPGVQLARHHLLARAILPQNQNVSVGRRSPVDQRVNARDRGGMAQQRRFGRGRRLRRTSRVTRPAQRGGGAHRGEQPLVGPGFGHEIGRATLHRCHRDMHAGMRGDHHHHHLGVDRGQSVEPRQPLARIGRAAREVGVEQHHVRRLPLDLGKRFFGALRRHDLAKQRPQQQSCRQQNVIVIIDDHAAIEFRPHPVRSRTVIVRVRTINSCATSSKSPVIKRLL